MLQRNIESAAFSLPMILKEYVMWHARCTQWIKDYYDEMGLSSYAQLIIFIILGDG